MDTFNKRNLHQFYDLEEGEIIEEEDEIRILENIDNSFYNCLQDSPTYPVKSDHRYKSNKFRKSRYPSDYISPRHSYESEYSLHPYSKFRRKELKQSKLSSSSKHESVKKYREKSKSPSWSSSESTCSCSSCSSSSSSSDSESSKASQLPSRFKDGYHHSKSSIKPNQEGKEAINQRVSSSSKNEKKGESTIHSLSKPTYKISKPVDSKNTNNNNHTERKPPKKSEVKSSRNQVSETGKASVSKRSIPLSNFSFHLPTSKLEDISSTDSCSNDSLSQTVLRDKDSVKTKVVPGSLGEMLLKKQLKCNIKRDYKLTNDSTLLNKLLNKKINSIKDNEHNSVKENEKCEIVDLCQEEDEDDDDELTLRIKALESAMKSRQLNSSGDLNGNQSSAFTQSDQNATSFKPFRVSGKKIYPDNNYVLKNEYENDSEYDAKTDSVQNADCKMFAPRKEPEENKNELDSLKREEEDHVKISDKHLSEADYVSIKSEGLGSNKCEITSVDMDISNDSFSGSATPGENNEIVMNENSCGTEIANQPSSNQDPSLPIPIEWAYMMPPPPQPDQPDNNLNSISNWCFNQNMYIQSMQDSVNETSSSSTWNVTDGKAIAESYSNPYYYPPLQMGKDENYDEDFRNENQDDYYNLKCGQSNDSTPTVELRDSHAEQYKSFMSTVMTRNNCQSSIGKKEVHRDLVNIPLEPSAQCVNPFVTGGSEKKNSKRRGRRRRRSSKRSGSGETSENLVGKVDAGKRNLVDEEDEDMLRALLLNDMTLKSKSKFQGISSPVGNEIQELDKDLFSGTISQGLHKTITLNNKVKSLKSSSPSRNQFQKLSDYNKEKKNKWLTERKLSNVTIVKQTSDSNKESSLLHGFSLSKFPPVKPVVISINNDSDSDVEQEEIHKENFRDNEQLISGIDSLLKSCRNKLSLNSQNANTPRSSNQSLIDYEKFKSIGGTPVLQTPKGVTHLSKEKQMEYRKLKQLMISKKRALIMKKRNVSSKNVTALTCDGKENISAVNRIAREKVKEDGVEIDQQSCSIAVFNEVAIKLDYATSDNDSDILKMGNTKEGLPKEVNQSMLDTSMDSESNTENLMEEQNITNATVRNVIFSTECILPITENIICVERKFSGGEFVNPFSEKKMLSTEKVMPNTMIENENKIPYTEKVKHINASTMNITESKLPVIEKKILNTENVRATRERVTSTTENVLPIDEIVTPIADNVAPIADNVAPIADNVAPIADNVAPIVDNVSPSADNVAPIVDNVVPIADNVSPIADNVSPIADNVSPIADNVSPIADNVSPIADNVSPIADNVSPIADNVAPIADNVAPIAGNVSPIAGNVSPIAGNLKSITEMEMSISENMVSTPVGVDNLSQICENDNPTSLELSEHNKCSNMHQISEDSSSSDSESSSSSEDSDSNDSEDEFSSLSVKGCLSLVQGSKREETEINLRNILLQKRLEKFRLKENDQQMSLETGKNILQKLQVEINKDRSGDGSSGDFINESYSTVVNANENIADDNIEVGSHCSSVIKSGNVDKNHPELNDKGIVGTTVEKGLENSLCKDVKDNEDSNASVDHSTSDENLKMESHLDSTHEHKLSLEVKQGDVKNMGKGNDPINKTVKAFLTQLQVNKSTSFKNDYLDSMRNNKPSSLSTTLRLVRSPKPLVPSEHSLTSEKRKLLENMDKKNVPQSFIRILEGVNTKLSSVKSLTSQISTLYKESMTEELVCQNKFMEIIKLLSQINLLRKERKEKTASISSNFVKVTSLLQKLHEEMNCLSRWETFVQKNYSAKEGLLSNIKKSKKEGELMYNHSALEVKKLKESVKLLSSQENILSKTFSKPLDNATQKRNPSSSTVQQRLSPKTKLFKLDNRVFKRQVDDVGGDKLKIQDLRVGRPTSVVSGNAISSDEKSPSFVSKQVQSSYRVEAENQSIEADHHENDKFAGDLVLCPYDLLGRCNDDQCIYFHMSTAAGQVRSPVHSSSRSSISYSNNFVNITNPVVDKNKISPKLDSDHLKLKYISYASYDKKCSKIDEISSEANVLPIPHKESLNETKETVAEDCEVREGPDLSIIPRTQASIQDRIDCFNQIACDMTAGNSELSEISECLPSMTSENSNYLDETSENSEQLNKSASDISISLEKDSEKPEHLATKRRHCKRRSRSILCRNSKKNKNDDTSSFISVSSRNDLSEKVDTTLGKMIQKKSIINLTPPIRRSRSILDRNSKKRKDDNASSSISVPSRSDLSGKVDSSIGNMEQEESNVNLTSPITSKTQNKLRKTLPPSKKTVELRRLRKGKGNSAPLARVLRSSKRNGKQLKR